MDQTIYYNCQFHIIRKPSEYQENITIYLKNKLRHWEVRFPNSERPEDAVRCPGLQQAAGPRDRWAFRTQRTAGLGDQLPWPLPATPPPAPTVPGTSPKIRRALSFQALPSTNQQGL